MNKQNATHYHIVLDKSGSMQSHYKETLEGLNEKLHSIKAIQERNLDQPIYVSLHLYHRLAMAVPYDRQIAYGVFVKPTTLRHMFQVRNLPYTCIYLYGNSAGLFHHYQYLKKLIGDLLPMKALLFF